MFRFLILATASKMGGLYRHNSIAAELQICIAVACKDDALKRIPKSPYVRLMLDKSLDFGVQIKVGSIFQDTC